MNNNKMTIKRALISVSDKTGLLEFARQLSRSQIEILSTGGTCKALKEAQIPVREVSEITGFPEIMDGRVKTLHPKIHGGILGLRDRHEAIAKQQQIPWIDLVVVNLYPFAKTIQKQGSSFDEALENIDIGGPTLIRAAAKNLGWVTVVVDPEDYEKIILELNKSQGLDFSTRRRLAIKAFAHTARYDALIENYLLGAATEPIEPRNKAEPETPLIRTVFPEQLNLSLIKHADLRYGENPHQAACAYQLLPRIPGILSAKQHQGKQLSYNNIADADAAFACVREFTQPACVIVKHGNPCGAAQADKIETAFQHAFAADSLSAFGGIIVLNRSCDKSLAQALSAIFMEVIVAPAYSPEALAILSTKPNLRVLELALTDQTALKQELKFIHDGLLMQGRNDSTLELEQLKVVTTLRPEPAQLETMLFAWQVLKHLKSNAILLAKEKTTVGIGTGQMSRIDAVEIALRKAGPNLSDTVLASDAFFPFRDSIDRIAQFCGSAACGVRAIIQPGGSVKDEEVIQACNELGIAMVFTGQRCFKH